MASARVLILLKSDSAWSRGVLMGFMSVAQECGWTLLRYDVPRDLEGLTQGLSPVAAVIAQDFQGPELQAFAPTLYVSVTIDRTAEGIASVCLDEAAIGRMACEHLRAMGLRNVTTFRWDESAFALARERAFQDVARAHGLRVIESWGVVYGKVDRRENPETMVAWLRGLPRPCGIFTCTDGWARPMARYAQIAGLRIPEDVALIGADNDVLECEMFSPPLSSVLIPWRELGRQAAELVQRSLAGKSLGGEPRVIAPLSVVARRSTELLAVDDATVAKAVAWIRENCSRRITVPGVARAVASGRHRLERAFRRQLGRTVQAEIRRARVEAAKRLLEGSRSGVAEVARLTGFKTASLLTVAFQRELGMPPGAYRRLAQPELAAPDAM